MNIKKQKGSTIIVCLVVMFFLSTLAILNFNSSRNDLVMSSNINIQTIKSQSAENGIKMVVEEIFTEDADINSILQLSTSEQVEVCSDKGVSKKEDCDLKYKDTNKTIKSKGIVSLNSKSECLTYGSSDTKANCYVIEGTGEIPVYDSKKTIHVQEVQINTININNNGIYEL